MLKRFEDEFMEAQANLVSLCLELLDITQTTVDKVYIYVYRNEYSQTFNAFFERDNKIYRTNDLFANNDVKDFLNCGIEDIADIVNVCQKYEVRCPYEFKLIYNVNTHQFDSEYRYEDLDDDKEESPMSRFMEWREEIKKHNKQKNHK